MRSNALPKKFDHDVTSVKSTHSRTKAACRFLLSILTYIVEIKSQKIKLDY